MLSVPEADAVVDPGTVVVHVEHTPVAGRAVVAPLRLEHIAHQAVPPPLVLIVPLMESLKLMMRGGKEYPENGDLARVSEHCLAEAP